MHIDDPVTTSATNDRCRSAMTNVACSGQSSNDRMRHLHLVHSNARFARSIALSCGVHNRYFDPEIQALTEHVRVIMPLSPAVRARALARARAAIEAPKVF